MPTELNSVGIKLFGSYSQSNIFLQLNNFPSAIDAVMSNSTDYNPLKPSNTYQAGAVIDISLFLTVSYNYDHSKFQLLENYSLPYIPNRTFTTLIDDKFTLNRLSLSFNIINKSTIHFTSSINGTNNKQNITVFGEGVTYGDKMWTGGWINRFDYHNIFAGLDMLYQTGKPGIINQDIPFNPLVASQNAHSFSLQNLYFGYRLKATHFKNTEIFASGRNVWQNKKSDITDNRKFYGIGFKLVI
ncbi:MAG: hypothetical protein AAGC65_21900 [Mucilaginibacter sp.]|uniref:hypothetical protein n=1 Tax=Mucilaginibacter sp. TaxID=1882438 RepID=UPI0031ABACF6